MEAAIDRARTFYGKEGRHAAPTSVAIDHWGFKAWSGNANVTLAAPIKFGLMEAMGKAEKRTVQLTELGLRLVREGNPNRVTDLRMAVLMPRIYAELWAYCEEKGGIPSDANLKWWLQQREFTEGAVGDFIRNFRASVGYAGLIPGAKMANVEQAEGQEQSEDAEPRRTPDLFSSIFGPPPAKVNPAAEAERNLLAAQPPQLLQFPIPLPDSDQLAALQVPSRMTDADWNQMLAIITAYKSSIVRSGKPDSAGRTDAPRSASEPEQTA